jgi:hypothetical protein
MPHLDEAGNLTYGELIFEFSVTVPDSLNFSQIKDIKNAFSLSGFKL